LAQQFTGATIKHFAGQELEKYTVALPPVSEQSRIVTRVEELMRLCDALEQQRQLETAQHAQLLNTLLGTLTDCTSPDELAAHWQRVSDHFDLLLDRPEAVDALEQTIVKLAIRGLLTSQSNQDQSAANLVASINDGRVTRRKKDSASIIAIDDQDFLPQGWCVTNIGCITECLDYIRRPIKKSERESDKGLIPYYGANGQVGTINDYLFDEDLVLVVEDETFIGRIKPFSYIIRGKSWVNNHAHVLRPLGGISVDYLNLCLERYDFIPLTSGTTNRRKLTQVGLLEAKLMIAPLAEQTRIVARVTQLRDLCTTLRQRLAAGQTTQRHLAEALVEV
jgi:type I restriction enzyme S subunit